MEHFWKWWAERTFVEGVVLILIGHVLGLTKPFIAYFKKKFSPKPKVDDEPVFHKRESDKLLVHYHRRVDDTAKRLDDHIAEMREFLKKESLEDVMLAEMRKDIEHIAGNTVKTDLKVEKTDVKVDKIFDLITKMRDDMIEMGIGNK